MKRLAKYERRWKRMLDAARLAKANETGFKDYQRVKIINGVGKDRIGRVFGKHEDGCYFIVITSQPITTYVKATEDLENVP